VIEVVSALVLLEKLDIGLILTVYPFPDLSDAIKIVIECFTSIIHFLSVGSFFDEGLNQLILNHNLNVRMIMSLSEDCGN